LVFQLGRLPTADRPAIHGHSSDSKERAGDFSEICKSDFTGGICNDRQTDATANPLSINQIYDPCAGSVNAEGACPGSTATPTPFAGNIIPAGRINPASAKLLKSVACAQQRHCVNQ